MSESTEQPERGSERETPTTPRWVKVSGALALVVVVLFVIVLLLRGGEHGPGRHAPPSGGHAHP